MGYTTISTFVRATLLQRGWPSRVELPAEIGVHRPRRLSRGAVGQARAAGLRGRRTRRCSCHPHRGGAGCGRPRLAGSGEDRARRCRSAARRCRPRTRRRPRSGRQRWPTRPSAADASERATLEDASSTALPPAASPTSSTASCVTRCMYGRLGPKCWEGASINERARRKPLTRSLGPTVGTERI